MKDYIQKATVRRNLDALCEFMHQQIDKTDLEVDKISISKHTDKKYHLTYNYVIISRFVTSHKNNADEFSDFRQKIDKILDGTSLSHITIINKSTPYVILKVFAKLDWLEKKDIVNSLTSIVGIIKFSL